MVINAKNQITQKAMKFLEVKKAEIKAKAEEIKELEKAILEALEKGIKPSKGYYTCEVQTTERRTPKYKEELKNFMSDTEINALIANTPPSISKKVKITVAA